MQITTSKKVLVRPFDEESFSQWSSHIQAEVESTQKYVTPILQSSSVSKSVDTDVDDEMSEIDDDEDDLDEDEDDKSFMDDVETEWTTGADGVNYSDWIYLLVSEQCPQYSPAAIFLDSGHFFCAQRILSICTMSIVWTFSNSSCAGRGYREKRELQMEQVLLPPLRREWHAALFPK